MCGDLEKMCSKSLKPLPLNSVIIMKWSHLNKLVQCHSAHLWMRQRFGTNSSSNSQVFVTQKDRPPDAACVNFLDLEKKGSLCTQVAILLRNSKSGDMNTKSCGILISRGCFWEISGHIKLGIANRNNLQDITLRKKNSNSSVSNYKFKASEDVPETIVRGVNNPVSKRFHQSTTILQPVAENSRNKSNSIMSPSLDRNALSVTGKVIGRTTDPFAESSDLSESTVRVELDLETSFLSVLDNQQNISKIMIPNCNLETDNFPFDFERHPIKDGTYDLAATKNENLSQRHSNFLPTKPKSGTAERSNPALSDSVLNLERIPGNLESASFVKQKPLISVSKLERELQSHVTNTGSGQAKYVAGENITGTSNFFNSGSFSQSLEPPSQIFQFEEGEPVGECQQLICPDSRGSHQKREESNLKLSQSEMNTDLQSNSSTNLHSKKTNIHSSGTTEDTNINQEAKSFNPMLDPSSGNSFSGAKPSVLIIDLNKLRPGHTVPSKKSEPLALRVTEIKSLAQGFGSKTRTDTSEKNSPVVTRVNSVPQVAGPMLPAVLHNSQQIPVNKEKIIISKSLPLHLCKDSVVVTCPSINVPCEEIMLPSKAIHVNIIKDVNPVSQSRKKIPMDDTGNVFKVNEGSERVSIESETQRGFLGKKVAIPKLVRQKKSKVAKEKIFRVSNPNGVPVVLISENSHALNNEASLDKLNIDLNSVSSRPISAKNSQVSVSEESSLDSDKIQECSKVAPSSINQVIISEDTLKGSTEIRKEQKLSKLKSEFSSIGNNQQLLIPQDLPTSPVAIVNAEKNTISVELNKTTDVLPTSVPEGAKPKIRVKTKEALLESRFSCIDDDNSSAKIARIDQTENAILRTVGDSIKPPINPEVGELVGPYSLYMSHEEISGTGRNAPQSALKVVSRVWKNSVGQPTARYKKPETLPSFNGKAQMEPLESTEKQLKCDEGVKNELNFRSDSSTPVSQSGNEYKASELEMLLKTSPRALKSFYTSKKSVTGSLGGAKEKETIAQHLQDSLSSSSDVFTTKAQSPKKAPTQYPGKFSTQTLSKDSSHFLTSASGKASTQFSNKISTKALGKASTQYLARPSERTSTQFSNKGSSQDMGKASAQSLARASEKAYTQLSTRASDCAALLNSNLSVVEVSNSPILIEETEPNSSAKIKEKVSVAQHDSVLFSDDTVTFKSKSVKDSKMSSSPCKKYMARNPSMKKGYLFAQHAHHSPFSSSDTSENHSPKVVASDGIVIPTVNQDVPETSNSPSRVKKAVPQSQSSAAKKNESKSSPKHSSPRETSTSKSLRLKKVTSVCASPLSTSTLKEKSSSSNPLESESSTVAALSSSDSSSSCAIPEKSVDNDVIWYRLDLNGEFDKLTYEETGFSTSASRLISAVMIAKTSNRTVRLVFDKSQNNEEMQQFKRGIYAVPTVNGNYVKIGPYKPNEPTGVKTSKKIKNNRYEDVPDLLGIEVDTYEADSMTGDMNAENQKGGSSKPEDTPSEMKQQEDKENNFASPGNGVERNQKIIKEDSQTKCKSPRIEANDGPKAPVEEHKNADSFSSGTGSVEKNHLGMPLKIPMVSLTRLSLNADKKQSTMVERKKCTDDEPLPKRVKVANPDVNLKLNVSKCVEEDSESSLMGVAHGDISSAQASKVEEYSLIEDTGELCNALDLEMKCGPNEGDSLICGKGVSSGPTSSLQAKEGDDRTVNITNVSGGCQLNKGCEQNEGSVDGTKSSNVIERAKVPAATESTKPSTPDKCLNNGKKKVNVARKSITIKHACMENAMMKNNASQKRMGMGMKAKEIGQISSGKASWQRKVVIPPLITLKESDIQSEEMYECGYLIPNNPKVDPIPAKKCLIPSESSAIIFQDPGRPGVFVKFEDIGDISNYIEHNLQKCVRSFPCGSKIEWTYSKNIPSSETELANSLKDTEVTRLANNVGAKPRSNRMMEDIENAKVQLLSLILPLAKSGDVELDEAITQALEEISSLQNHDEHLCQTYVVEKRKKLKLVEKLRPLLKAHGTKTVSECNGKEAQLKNSLKEDLDEISDAGGNLKDRSKRGRCSKRIRGKHLPDKWNQAQ
ncbi:serine-rich adhesin for platelets-like isoform X2 [Hetaerina americana]|uniref:serine-rich adhesin for platelets-like isoform X2 n=1 Tax=Hetaerina americana TaxID=62018 RepID=UPI003A7F2540